MLKNQKIKKYNTLTQNLKLFLIFTILICSCKDNHDENYQPEEIHRHFYTAKLKDDLFFESYLNVECDCQDVFLTDSINFRLYILFYNKLNGRGYDYVIDSNKITFYIVYYEKGKKDKYRKSVEYTFEELKKKKNLRRKSETYNLYSTITLHFMQ